MYIENAELSEKHAEIIFNQYCQYTMKDCSDHKTTKGTWVKVPTSGKGVDIYANQNLNRKYMINKHKYAFHFEETKESLREVELWMQSNHLHFARAMLVQEKITRLP